MIDLYTRVGEHDKAVDRLLKSLEAVQSTPAENLPYILPYKLAQVSEAYLAQKKWAQAEPYLREALALREKAQPEDWQTFHAQAALGASLLGQKR